MSSVDPFLDFTDRLESAIRRFRPDELAASDGWSGQFGALALELFALQYHHNPYYRSWADSLRLRPDSVRSWTEIPALPTRCFKSAQVTAIPPQERRLEFLSSGTTGSAPSRHIHSTRSVALYEASLWVWFRPNLSPLPSTNLVCLTPDPSQAPGSSLVHMFETVRAKLDKPARCFFGCAGADGTWHLDESGLLDALEAAGRENSPCLLLGTAFNFVQLLDRLEQLARRFSLPAGSRVLETGGYKGRTRELPKPELHRWISDSLGVPSTHIVTEYGMSESSSQAYTRPESQSPGALHFPPWARPRVLSPETGRDAAPGEPGLIQILDLANVYSCQALLTEDLGILHRDTLELVGRANLTEPRGCSLFAADTRP